MALNITTKQAREIAAGLDYTTANEVKIAAARTSYKTLRGFVGGLTKEDNRRREEYTAPDVYEVELKIYWFKNPYWGYNPTVELWARTAAGCVYIERAGHASGCGYCKRSAAMAEALNRIFSGMFYRARNKRTAAPYGAGGLGKIGSFPGCGA